MSAFAIFISLQYIVSTLYITTTLSTLNHSRYSKNKWCYSDWGHRSADVMPTQPTCGYQIFSIWSGIMGFERAALIGQVEHDLLIAIRKPKRGKQRRVLASLGRPPHMFSQVHAEKSQSAFLTALSRSHGLDEYLHILTHKELFCNSLQHYILCSLILFLWHKIRPLFQLIITVELQKPKTFLIIKNKYSTNYPKQ